MPRRDHYFDNAKFILVLLVVLGHSLELVSGPYVSTLYDLIYLFHMPAFVLITGYFSRGETQPKVGNLLAQYLIFQTLYLLFNRFVLKGNTPFTFTTPYWILWFLLSAIIWKIITPLLARYPFGLVLGIGVLAAVLAGYDSTLARYLSLSRTFVFFPFFWLGYHVKKEHFVRLKKIPAPLSLGIFALSGIALHNVRLFPKFFLYATNPYEALKLDGWEAGFSRLFCLLWGLVLVCCFFSLVTLKKTVFSTLGQRTSQVFLLHGFALQAAKKFLPLPVLLDTTLEKLLFTVACTAVLLLLLSRLVTKLGQPLLNPVPFWGRLRRAHHS